MMARRPAAVVVTDTQRGITMLSKLRYAALVAMISGGMAHAGSSLTIDVHRDANCGCCKEWIQYLEQNGFTVKDHVEPNMSAVKQRSEERRVGKEGGTRGRPSK